MKAHLIFLCLEGMIYTQKQSTIKTQPFLYAEDASADTAEDASADAAADII